MQFIFIPTGFILFMLPLCVKIYTHEMDHSLLFTFRNHPLLGAIKSALINWK